MDDTLDAVNAVAAVFSSAVLGYVVLDQRIREGAWVKAGLVVVIFALLASAALTLQGGPSWAWQNVGLACRTGIALVCVGVLIRANRMGEARRARDGTKMQQARTRGILRMIADPARDVADMLRSDWAALEESDDEQREHRS